MTLEIQLWIWIPDILSTGTKSISDAARHAIRLVDVGHRIFYESYQLLTGDLEYVPWRLSLGLTPAQVVIPLANPSLQRLVDDNVTNLHNACKPLIDIFEYYLARNSRISIQSFNELLNNTSIVLTTSISNNTDTLSRK